MKGFFDNRRRDFNLKEEYDRKLDEALSAQAKGDLSAGQRLLKESQQIFVQWAEKVKGAEA